MSLENENNLNEELGNEIKRSSELKKVEIDIKETLNIITELKKHFGNNNDVLSGAFMPLLFQTIFSEVRHIRSDIERPIIFPFKPLTYESSDNPTNLDGELDKDNNKR